MSTQPTIFLTPEQYLEIERRAEYKSEYYRGEMFAMAGASWEHTFIKDNVARHAGVREVGVQLWVDRDKLNLQVRDKGIGFDRRSEKRSTYSSGLLGMQERAELLEGQLNVESAPGAGTRLTAELPLIGSLQNKQKK